MSQLVCCLCNYGALSDTDLETHIDSNHADIFRFSSAMTDNVPPEVKVFMKLSSVFFNKILW